MGNDNRALYNADQRIIEDLRQDGTARRKSEEQLFTIYHYFIQEGAQKHNLSEDEAFDAYSDSVLSAIDELKKGSFEGRSSLKTWLYQIFHNKCVDLLRKKATNKNSVHLTTDISNLVFQLSDTSKSIVQRLADKADWDILRQKINELGENCQRLLVLAADGYSDKEIAILMEYKTTDVVKTSRLRCLDRLRKLYKRP
jgi:RNA polymerase sigma factor (sigma-70 family)